VFAKAVKRYSLRLGFALGLLLGIQLPNFLALYEQRLDAHYIEAEKNLAQYQKLADLFFDGDLNALIGKHKNSEVDLFKAEVKVIEHSVQRFNLFNAEKEALKGNLLHRLYFLTTKIDSPLFNETNKNYQAEVILNQDAISVGLIFALIISFILELFFLLIRLGVKKSPCSLGSHIRSVKI
jgi:hypothetical protein